MSYLVTFFFFLRERERTSLNINESTRHKPQGETTRTKQQIKTLLWEDA